MSKFNSANEYFQTQEKWKDALLLLRKIALSANLQETLKWGIPTYTYESKNIFSISAFKGYFGIWFYQGKFLSDTDILLSNAQEGKTEGMRQMRFSDKTEINERIVKRYMLEAIDNHKKCKKITPQNKPLLIPQELSSLLETNPGLSDDFDSLTLSKKREYAEYIIEAVRDETKARRLDKIQTLIRKRVGLNDKYK